MAQDVLGAILTGVLVISFGKMLFEEVFFRVGKPEEDEPEFEGSLKDLFFRKKKEK